MLPADALERAEAAARECDLLIVAGTSGEVYPAAALPRYAHGQPVRGSSRSTRTKRRSPTSRTTALRGPSAVVLPALVAAAWPGSTRLNSRR